MKPSSPGLFMFIVFSLPLGVFLFLCPIAAGEYRPDFGLHCDGTGLVDDLNGPEAFAAAASARGYSVLMINLIPESYYFTSPTLASLHYRFGEDLLNPLVAASHARGLRLFIDIQTLGWKARGWPGASDIPGDIPATAQVVQVVQELSAAGIDGVSEEGFLSQWMAPVAAKCRQQGMLYLHKATPYDAQDFVEDGNGGEVLDYFAQADILMTMDYYLDERLASDAFIPALARGLGKTYWLKSSPENWGEPGNGPGSLAMMENVIYLLALRERPPVIFHMIDKASDFNQVDLTREANYLSEWGGEENRPLANLVPGLTGLRGPDENHPLDEQSWFFLAGNLPALLNALGASGLEVNVTSSPRDGAAVRFFYTRGAWWEGINPLDLPYGFMSVLTDPVQTFIQTAGVVPAGTTNWLRARLALGLNDRQYDYLDNGEDYQDLPNQGVYHSVAYRHFRPGAWESSMGDIHPEDVTGASLLSRGSHGGSTYVLLTRKGNKYFVNGGALDLAGAFPLAAEINGAMLSPANCIINSGRVTAFYPLENLALKFRFPLYPQARLKWLRLSTSGEETRGTLDYLPARGLEANLIKWNLYLVAVDRYLVNPDLNSDGSVDSLDLGILLGTWGSPFFPQFDLDGSGRIDRPDLDLLIANFRL